MSRSHILQILNLLLCAIRHPLSPVRRCVQGITWARSCLRVCRVVWRRARSVCVCRLRPVIERLVQFLFDLFLRLVLGDMRDLFRDSLTRTVHNLCKEGRKKGVNERGYARTAASYRVHQPSLFWFLIVLLLVRFMVHLFVVPFGRPVKEVGPEPLALC